jgi:hypothetical protein
MSGNSLVTETAESGERRTEVALEELAAFYLHALTAARSLGVTEAIHRAQGRKPTHLCVGGMPARQKRPQVR